MVDQTAVANTGRGSGTEPPLVLLVNYKTVFSFFQLKDINCLRIPIAFLYPACPHSVCNNFTSTSK